MEMFWSRVVTKKHWHSCVCRFRKTFFGRPGGSTMQKAGTRIFIINYWIFAIEQWMFVKLKARRPKSLAHFPDRFGSKSLRSVFTRSMHGLCRWTVDRNNLQLWSESICSWHSCFATWDKWHSQSRTRKLPFFLRDWKMFCRCHRGNQHATNLFSFPIFQWHFIFCSRAFRKIGIDPWPLATQRTPHCSDVGVPCMFTTTWRGGVSVMCTHAPSSCQAARPFSWPMARGRRLVCMPRDAAGWVFHCL